MVRILTVLTLGIGKLCLGFLWLWQWKGYAFWAPWAITALTIFYHFGVRLAVGWGFRRWSPQGTAAWFRPHPWEENLYRTLNIKAWKGKLPTARPKDFLLRRDNLPQVITATCRAEVSHEICLAASFVPLLFARWFGAFPVFLITSILAAVLADLPFVLVQRYNRPRLVRAAHCRAEKSGA